MTTITRAMQRGAPAKRTALVVEVGAQTIDAIMVGSRQRLNALPVIGAMPTLGDTVEVEQRNGVFVALTAGLATSVAGGIANFGVVNVASTDVGIHDISGVKHTGTLLDAQAPQFVKRDGQRQVDGLLGVSVTGWGLIQFQTPATGSASFAGQDGQLWLGYDAGVGNSAVKIAAGVTVSPGGDMGVGTVAPGAGLDVVRTFRISHINGVAAADFRVGDDDDFLHIAPSHGATHIHGTLYVAGGYVYADSYVSGSYVTGRTALNVGDETHSGTITVDADALYLDTSSAFVASKKPFIVWGNATPTKYVTIRAPNDADIGHMAWQASDSRFAVTPPSSGSTPETKYFVVDVSDAGGAGLFATADKWFFNGGATYYLAIDVSNANAPRFTSHSEAFAFVGASTARTFGINLSDGGSIAFYSYGAYTLNGTSSRYVTIDPSSLSTSTRFIASQNAFSFVNTDLSKYFGINVINSGVRFFNDASIYRFYDSGAARYLEINETNSGGTALRDSVGLIGLNNSDGSRNVVFQFNAATPKMYTNNGTLRYQTSDAAWWADITIFNEGLTFELRSDSGAKKFTFYKGTLWLYPTTGSHYLSISAEAGIVFTNYNGWFEFKDGTSGALTDIETDANGLTIHDTLNLPTGKVFTIADVQVVGPRSTGWTAWTGTANKGTYDADTYILGATSYDKDQITWLSERLVEARQAIKALTDALRTHGLIGT